MNNYYYCIDVGGTTIKGGVVDENNNILFSSWVKTRTFDGSITLAENIVSLLNNLQDGSGLKIDKAKGLGVGVAGIISNEGVVCRSANLNLNQYPLKTELEKIVNIPIKIANDACIAGLAETAFGAGKDFSNYVMLTLGTGIGGEIIINGKAFRLSRCFSSEMGHMKITDRNIRCGCGEYGCFESVASTIALERQTREAMEKNKDSKMWEKYTPETVTGKTVFEYKDIDKTASTVFKNYIKYLGTGIVNLINILHPEAVVIGGAVSAQKDALTTPLKEYVYAHIYARGERPLPEILNAKASGNAGILGAKCLFN